MIRSLHIAVAALLAGALAAPAMATSAVPGLKGNHPDRYIVQKGDTLWDISGRFLSEPWRWPDVWQANPHIKNPHLIFPGDEVFLTYQDGRPVIRVRRRGKRGVTYLSPRVRAESLADEAIPTIPVDAIAQFLARPRVVTEAEFDAAAYIISVGQEALSARPGGKVYARGIADPKAARYSIYRKGQPYVDSDAGPNVERDGFTPRPLDFQSGSTARADLPAFQTRLLGLSTEGIQGEILGFEALHVADAVMTRPGDPSTLVITSMNREVLVGDRLVPVNEEETYQNYMPRPAGEGLNGRIISVVDGVTQIGQYQTVVVNLGSADGLEPGHVFGVFQSGGIVEDPMARDPRMEELDERARKRAEAQERDSAFGFAQGIGHAVEATSDAIARVVREVEVATAGEKPWAEVELPEERAGTIMIYRPFERLSYGLVMEATRAMHVNDRVKNP